MDNADIAQAFEEIADLLSRSKDSPFKIRAYRRAASTIRDLPVGLEQLRQRGDLRRLPGIGDAIAKKLDELLDTGRLEFLVEPSPAPAD